MTVTYPSRLRRVQQKLGLRANNNLYWSCRKEKNFGDWIGPYIFEALSGQTAVYCMPTQLRRGHVTFTVGSILQWIKAPGVVDVWGSGIIRADTDFARPRRVYAVRGPRSRARMRALGYDCPEVFGDPALLMPRIFAPQVEVTHSLGVVAHFVDAADAARRFAKMEDLKLIDVLAPPEQVIREILSCRTIASSSLHGIIVAHAYGIPALHLRLSDDLSGDGVKFQDYVESFDSDQRLPVIEATRYEQASDLVTYAQDNAVCPDPTALQEGLLHHCPFLSAQAWTEAVDETPALTGRTEDKPWAR